MTRSLRLLGASALMLGMAIAFVTTQAQATPAFKAGELMIMVNSATARTDVDKIASSVNATVVHYFPRIDFLGTRDAYHLRINGTAVADAVTLAAVDTLNKDARVVSARPNYYLIKHDQTPNDPRYKEQWGLPLMNMPKAWDIEKGKATVKVGVTDTGVDPNHEDLKDRLLPGLNTTVTPATTNVADGDGHGTHVSGIIAASTDNGKGVAGVTWENVKVVPVKVLSDQGVGTLDWIVAGLSFLETQQVQVINMSLGREDSSEDPDLNDPVEAKIDAMANKGFVFTISAGNSFLTGNPGVSPARLAKKDVNVICVAACGPLKEHSVYSSSHSYTTVAAPGGNDPTFNNPANQILSTLPNNNYGVEQGTSMASPACAGVVALLLSIPGVQPGEIKDLLTSTADPAGKAVPNPDQGAGVVDANAALLKAAVSVTILEPDGTGGKASRTGLVRQPDPIETLRPLVRISVRNVFQTDLVVLFDNIAVTDYTVSNVTKTKKDGNGVDQPFAYEITWTHDVPPGSHVISVTGTNQGPPARTDTDTRTFQLIPHLIPQGRSLVAIPYFQDGVTPEYYLGTDFRLARWLPDQGRYVFYTSFGPKDPGASFNTDIVTHQDGDATSKSPLGLAYWSDTESAKPVLTKGQALLDKSFVIPLRGNGTGNTNFISWNMIGDPFPFDVPFNALLVDTPEGRLSIQIAAEKGYILPNIYSYDGAQGYTFRSLPDGALRAWTGHWVGVTSRLDIAIVVPPLKSTRAAAVPVQSTVNSSGWSMRLQATSKDLRDTFNFIGVSSRASDGYDLSDVAKPPMMSPYLTLAIDHSTDWTGKAGLYAQDIRSAGGTKTWHVVVGTDQTDASVLLTWDSGKSLPRDVKLTIKDDSTGQVTDMRTRNSVSFTNGTNQTSRRFTITATQRLGGAVRISNVAVRPTRASGSSVIGFTLTGDATYDVRIMSATGQNLTTVGSRAAAAGDVSVVWNGKDSANRAVPAGTYIVQIRATGPDGESVKVIQPFAMLR